MDEIGTVAWERAGGPPLTLVQRASVLGGAAVVVATDVAERLLWHLLRRAPAPVDLDRHPREGFGADAAAHAKREALRNPGCLDPLFPLLVKAYRFSSESRRSARGGP